MHPRDDFPFFFSLATAHHRVSTRQEPQDGVHRPPDDMGFRVGANEVGSPHAKRAKGGRPFAPIHRNRYSAGLALFFPLPKRPLDRGRDGGPRTPRKKIKKRHKHAASCEPKRHQRNQGPTAATKKNNNNNNKTSNRPRRKKKSREKRWTPHRTENAETARTRTH